MTGTGSFGRSGTWLRRAISRPHLLFQQPTLNGSEFFRRKVTLRLRITQVSEEFTHITGRTLIFQKQRTNFESDPCQNRYRKCYANHDQSQPHFVLGLQLTLYPQQKTHDLPPTRTRYVVHSCIIWCWGDILKE